MRYSVTVLCIFMIAMGIDANATVVSYEDGRMPTELQSMAVDSIAYYRFDEFCSILGGSWTWNPSVGRAIMRRGDDSLAVTVGSPFFIQNNHQLCADHPVISRDGAVWVPADFLTGANLLFSDVFTRLSEHGDSLYVESHECDVHVLSFRQDSLSTTLSLLLPSGATWNISPLRNRRCSVNITGAEICSDEIDSLTPRKPLRSLSSKRSLGISYINFSFTTAEVSVHARQPAGGGPLTISIAHDVQDTLPERETAGPYEVRTIVIDAGHGGTDEGVRSQRGIKEKDVTSSIASSIVSIVERRSPNIDVVLTRLDDAYAGLESRIESANNRHGDLFISIHCNASFNRSLKGFQAFFLSPSVTDAARFVAARENAVLSVKDRESPSDSGLVFLPWDRIHDSWLTQSMQVTRSITDAARKRLDTTVHDPAQAALYVLSGVDMPSVLIEVGYLTNSIEARKLAETQYLDQIALAIVEGIEEFIRIQEMTYGDNERPKSSTYP